MPKFYHNPDDRAKCAGGIEEDLWFRRNQRLLLAMANTTFGRELLEIPKDYPQIVKFTKCSVHGFMGFSVLGNANMMGDFRIGAKWANVIRARWDAFNSYARYFQSDATLASPLARYALSLSSSTLTVYPDPGSPGTTTFDAVCDDYYGTWSTIRGAANAQYLGGTNTNWIVGDLNGGSSYEIQRNLGLFDTSSLGAGANVSATTLSLYVNSETNNRNGVDAYHHIGVVSANPASNTTAALADYSTFGTTRYATDLEVGALSNATYNVWTFNSTGIAAVSLTGLTKIGTRTNGDIDNVAGPNSLYTQQMVASSADVAGTTQDPKLIVTYSLATFTKNIFPNLAVNRSYLY